MAPFEASPQNEIARPNTKQIVSTVTRFVGFGALLLYDRLRDEADSVTLARPSCTFYIPLAGDAETVKPRQHRVLAPLADDVPVLRGATRDLARAFKSDGAATYLAPESSVPKSEGLPSDIRPFGEPCVEVDEQAWRDLLNQKASGDLRRQLEDFSLWAGPSPARFRQTFTAKGPHRAIYGRLSVQFNPLVVAEGRTPGTWLSGWEVRVVLRANTLALGGSSGDEVTEIPLDLETASAEEYSAIWDELNIQLGAKVAEIETRL